MDRVYNFSAGPAQLPLSVLEKAQKEFLSFEQSGISVMELSHRSKLFETILEQTEQLLREVMEFQTIIKFYLFKAVHLYNFQWFPLIFWSRVGMLIMFTLVLGRKKR